MPPHPFRLHLPAGDPAIVRPVAPDDRDRLRAALAQTSLRTRTARFGRDLTAFTEAELDYFTRVDQRDHVAWCAVAGWLPGEPGIGSARFVRDRDDPTLAEMAVAVLDEYHGMGVGTSLVAVLYAIGLESGIRSFVGQVLAENHAVLRRLRRLGAEVVWRDVIYEVRLPVEPGGPPAADADAAGRFRAVLRSIADGHAPGASAQEPAEAESKMSHHSR